MPHHQNSPHWQVFCGDILEYPADALICSANVQLNMSGGVGGAILLRYGDRMQQELWDYRASLGVSFVSPGTVAQTSSGGTPFRFVVHAVAVDGFYQTTRSLLVSTIRAAVKKCSEGNAETVALTALATGYGHLSVAEFGKCIEEIAHEVFVPVKTITVVMQNSADTEELANVLKSSASRC